MKRIINYLSIIKPLVFLIVIYMFSLLCCAIINYIISGLFTGDFNSDTDIFENQPHLMIIILNSNVSIIYFIWYRKLIKNDKTKIESKSLILKNIKLLLLLGLGVIFLVNGAVNLLLMVINKFFPFYFGSRINVTNYIYEGSFILSILRTAIISPIAEELVFRGVILKKAKDIMPFYVANIIQALLFGIVHMDPIQATYAFLYGLLFGYMVLKYQSIIPSIALHMLNNTIGVIFGRYQNSVNTSIDVPLWFWILLTLVGSCMLIIYFYIAKCEKKNLVVQEKIIS